MEEASGRNYYRGDLPMNIGAIIGKLFWFVLGIYNIFLSIRQKEKLGNKAVMVRFAGILMLLVGLLVIIESIITKR